MKKAIKIWTLAIVAVLSLTAFFALNFGSKKVMADEPLTIVSVTMVNERKEHKDTLFQGIVVEFSEDGNNNFSFLVNTVFKWLNKIKLNGELINADPYVNQSGYDNGYYSSTYFDGNNLKRLKCFIPDDLYKTDEVNEFYFPAGFTLNGKTLADTVFYGWLGELYAERSAAVAALAAKPSPEEVNLSSLYVVDADSATGKITGKEQDVFMHVYVRFPVEGQNEATAISVIRSKIKLNGRYLNDVIPDRMGSIYFDPYNAEYANQLKVLIPYSLINWTGYDVLEIPGGYTLRGTYIVGATFYGRGGEWSKTENDPALSEWQFAHISEIYETNRFFVEKDGEDDVYMDDAGIIFDSEGGNTTTQDIWSLWYLRAFIKLNGEKTHIQGGFYYNEHDYRVFYLRLRESLRGDVDIADELYIPKYFIVGNKIYLGGETWYGRYGKWSKNAAELPEVDDPEYVGTVTGISEPEGVADAFYGRLQITFSISARGDNTDPNVRQKGCSLQTLVDGIKINGNNGLRKTDEVHDIAHGIGVSLQVWNIEGSWYWVPGSDYTVFQLWLHDSDRDPHGNDYIDIPSIRMVDGKITKAQRLYFYDSDGDHNSEWHLTPRATTYIFSPIDKTGAGYTGKILFDAYLNDCAQSGDEVLTADKILFNGKTAVELGAMLGYTANNELTFTISENVYKDGMTLQIADGFTLPSGEKLSGGERYIYSEFYRYWLTSFEPFEREEWNRVAVNGIAVPKAQASGAVVIEIMFSGKLVQGNKGKCYYDRVADVTSDAYTLYAKSKTQIPGYYYDEKDALIYLIKYNVRNSVMDSVSLNGKSVREIISASETVGKDVLQIDFYGNKMLIWFSNDYTIESDFDGLRIGLKSGLIFESGKTLNSDFERVYSGGVWIDAEEYDKTNGGDTETADEKAANAVIALIDAFKASVTIEDKAAVNSAKSAYDALTDAQKALVPQAKVKKLNDAAEAIAQLEKGAEDSVGTGGCSSKTGENFALSVAAIAGAAIVITAKRKRKNKGHSAL